MPDGSYIVGQTVVLKSGGPVMAVSAISGAVITCIWFFNNALSQSDFAQNTLTNVPDTVPQLQQNGVWTTP